MVTAVARRYAKALFEFIAQSSGDRVELRGARTVLDELAKAIRSDPRLVDLLQNPAFTKEDRLAVVGGLASRVSPPESVTRFLALLGRKRRLGQFVEIADAFGALVDQGEGRERIRLCVARSGGTKDAEWIRQRLESATGRSVEMEIVVDPALIGGAVVEMGALRIDGSAQGMLNGLRRAMAP